MVALSASVTVTQTVRPSKRFSGAKPLVAWYLGYRNSSRTDLSLVRLFCFWDRKLTFYPFTLYPLALTVDVA